MGSIQDYAVADNRMTTDDHRKLARELLATLKALSTRQKQSRRYGPAQCRQDQLALIDKFYREAWRAGWQAGRASHEGEWALSPDLADG